MSGSVRAFLEKFANNPRFALPLPVLWKVDIQGIHAAIISSILIQAGEKWTARNEIDDYIGDDTILVAQEITIPNESLNIQPYGVDDRGGFLPGYGMIERTDFASRAFTINFLETHDDIEHNLFRPWLMALAIEGLVKSQLKATVTVKQYGNDGSFRKGYEFKKAIPINVEGGAALNYANTDFIVKTVSFICENYAQIKQ
jgi:hypothetical protein